VVESVAAGDGVGTASFRAPQFDISAQAGDRSHRLYAPTERMDDPSLEDFVPKGPLCTTPLSSIE